MARRTAIAALVATVALVYGNGLSSDFVWDDASIVLERSGFFADPANIRTVLTSEDSTHVTGATNPYYRPLNILSYMLDYHLWGHDPFWYHLENLLLHALAVVLLFLLVEGAFDDRMLAFVTALVFAVHPVNSESVSFISARNNILCATLFFGSLLALCRSRGGGWQAALAAPLLFLLALASKEPAVAIPFFLASLTWFTRKESLATDRRALLAYFAVLLAYFAIRFLVLGTFTSNSGPALSLEKLRLMASVYCENFRLILFPFHLNAHYTREFLAFGWADAAAAVSGVGLLVFFSLWRRSPEPVRAGCQWMFWGLLPVSNLVAIPSAPVAERYLYAIVPGSALVAAYLVRQLRRRNAVRPVAMIALVAAVVVALGARTFTRNRVWADDLTLDTSMIRSDPSNAFAHMNLGITYSGLGRVEEAERELRESIRLNGSNPRARYNLAALYISENRLVEAKEENEAAVSLDATYAKARSSLGVIYMHLGRHAEAARELEAAVKLEPTYAEGHNNLGMLYGKLGRLEEAIVEFENATRLQPGLAATHYNLGVAHMQSGRPGRAREAFARAAELDPRHAQPQPLPPDSPPGR